MEKLPQFKDQYQVHFFASRTYLPFSCFIHSWIVVVEQNEVFRFEILHYKTQGSIDGSFLHLNHYSPTEGMALHQWSKRHWSSRCLGSVNGGPDSLASKMVRFIQEEGQKYPGRDRYVLFPGPNSNTYVQWILSKFPECKIKLPQNAPGKSYAKNLSL